MRISSRLFFCLFALSLFSCVQGRGEKERVMANEKVKMEASGAAGGQEILPGEEDFDRFIHKFSAQESFQLDRVKFPISVIVPDTGHEGMPPMEETIGRYEWELLDLAYDSSYLTRPYDRYYQVVRYRNDTAVVEIRGIDNGIYADYYFTLIDDKWYLVTLYEASF